MRQQHRRNWGASLIVLTAALCALGVGVPRDAAAQGPRGAFTGVPPLAGATAFLVATEDATAAALAGTLRDAGCDVGSVALLREGAWSVNVAGAPAAVNEAFPALVRADTPFFVRCLAQIVPLADPGNETYSIDGAPVTLSEGSAQSPAAPGSSTVIVTTLSDRRGYGELDGDGHADTAVEVIQNPGGSGTFSYLVVSASGGGGPLAGFFLGDRVQVDRIAIAHGQVVVSYLDRPVLAPFVEPPSVPVTRIFELRDGLLVEVPFGAP